MLLLGHNAHLTQVIAPAVPADPAKGIAGALQTIRWQGVAEAYIDEDLVDEVRQGQRVTFSRTIIDLPVNLPVWPNEEDLVTIIRSQVIAPEAQGAPQSETMVVRGVDGGMVMLGRLRLVTARGGP